jgi:hypothetical protein
MGRSALSADAFAAFEKTGLEDESAIASTINSTRYSIRIGWQFTDGSV